MRTSQIESDQECNSRPERNSLDDGTAKGDLIISALVDLISNEIVDDRIAFVDMFRIALVDMIRNELVDLINNTLLTPRRLH
jgi:hypothetical protein